jgi:hypothetical protein
MEEARKSLGIGIATPWVEGKQLMSATRDSARNATFVFSNFYHLYQKEKSRSGTPSSPITGIVLAQRAEATVVLPTDQESYQSWARNEVKAGKKSLAAELLELRNARKRLSFLIQEMDELLKRE